jgi:carbohydrate-selective porin OprB
MLYPNPAKTAEHSATADEDGRCALNKTNTTGATEEKSDQGLGWFGRLAYEPQNRNFIDFYFDTGLTYKGLIPTRDGDTLGIAIAYAHLSSGVQETEVDESPVSVGAETALELTYQAQLTKWLSIQPDLQVIINPGGNNELKNAIAARRDSCRA